MNATIGGICASLAAGGYSVKFQGFSALDRYMGLPALPFLWAETDADLAVLARYIENLRFPGADIADGAADTSEGTCYFRCVDAGDSPEVGGPSFPLLSFIYDWRSRRFQDPLGLYPLLRELRDGRGFNPSGFDFRAFNAGAGSYRAAMEGALILARYSDKTGAFRRALEELLPALGNSPPQAAPELERTFLTCLMVSPRPGEGLEFLKGSGFLGELWPELAALDDVDHSKEFHPEGNVWKHTLETFRHRKAGSGGAYDLRLSLGLLLHDAGKPLAESFGNRRFDGHAELGARAAAKFLGRLGFEPSLVEDIFYLVKNHMLPAALKRLPLSRTGEIMASPLFPTLMELYRCDESSSFKGLDGYYENSAAYQTFLKNTRNPYRSADGKKLERDRPARMRGR